MCRLRSATLRARGSEHIAARAKVPYRVHVRPDSLKSHFYEGAHK
jgi:hypothetical protein